MAAPSDETVEALVRDELRAPFQQLVRRLVPEPVAEALNGAGLNGAGRPRVEATEQPLEATEPIGQRATDWLQHRP